MSVKYIEENYENYGRCLTISNGRLVVKVTLDVGPRIIYASLDGDANIFFNDLARAEKRENIDAVYSKEDVWYIYGGTRLWFSPEEFPTSYYPDNDKVEYKIENGKVTFTPPVQRATNMQQIFTLAMDDEKPMVKVDYTAKNMGNENRRYSLWAMSVCDKNGIALIPQPKDETGLLANRVLAIWPYTDMADERIIWGKDYISVKECSDENVSNLKLGINNTFGRLGFMHGKTFFKVSYTPDHENGEYPDYGVSCEVFTCKNFLEAETLSPIFDYAPGDEHTHTETWEFCAIDGIPEYTAENMQAVGDKYLK